MKTRIIGLSLTILAISLLSCTEDPRPTQVWGKAFCSPCGAGYYPLGTLSESGGDNFGWCTRTDTGLSFVVAQKDPQATDFLGEYYFEVRGIQGPPEVGVYEEDGISIKDGPYTTFESIRIMNTNVWEFDDVDIPDPDQCYVRLFAEAGEGELTADEYGDPEPFELYVHIECNGIAIENSQGSTLSSTTIRFFFDECN